MSVKPVALPLSAHQKDILEVVTEDPKLSAFPASLCKLVVQYCDLKKPEDEVRELYHARFIERIGLERLARLPVVTAAGLDVDKRFPWCMDESIPDLDVTKMPFQA